MSYSFAVTKEVKEENYTAEQLSFIEEYKLPINAIERGKYISALGANADNDPDIQVLLGKYYVLVDFEYGMINRGRMLLEKAVNNGRVDACYMLGKIYEDFDKAQNNSLSEWTKKRIRLKNSLKIYEKGENGGCSECKKAAAEIRQKLKNHEASGDSCLVQLMYIVFGIIGVIFMGYVGVIIQGVAGSINSITIPAIIILVGGGFLLKMFRK